MNKFKEWLSESYWALLITVFVAAAVFSAAIIIPLEITAPTYSTQASVTAVGYKGITVTYAGEYGKKITQKVDCNDSKQYQVGDVVTIKIKGIFGSAKIDEGA